MAVRINYGDLDWQVDMSMDELEHAIETATNLAGNGFVRLKLLMGGDPHRTIRIRPSTIRFYYEELDQA